MSFVFLRFALGRWVGPIYKNGRGEADSFSGFSIIEMVPAERILVLSEGIVIHLVLNCGCGEGGSSFSYRWLRIAVVFSGRLEREALAVVLPSERLLDISCDEFTLVGDGFFDGGLVVASTVMVALVFHHVIELLQVRLNVVDLGYQHLRVFLIFLLLRLDGL
jgi:hypothetical protein